LSGSIEETLESDDNRSLVQGSKSAFPGEVMLTTQPGISVKITQI